MTKLLDLRLRVLGSFLEMPGLSLRLEQAARLFALDHSVDHLAAWLDNVAEVTV